MSSPIHTTVMRRVRILYVIGLIFNTVTLSVFVAIVAIGALAHSVDIGSVWHNMPGLANGTAPEQFLITAFEHTKFVTQTALSALIFASIYFFYRFMINLRVVPSVRIL